MRGHISQRNKSTLTWLCSIAKEKKVSKFISTTSKLALLGSYTVWVARRSPDWSAGNLLKPGLVIFYSLVFCIITTNYVSVKATD